MSEQVCAHCGRPARDGETLLSWMHETDVTGRSTWTCTECVRDNVRSIEAKLDQQWW